MSPFKYSPYPDLMMPPYLPYMMMEMLQITKNLLAYYGKEVREDFNRYFIMH